MEPLTIGIPCLFKYSFFSNGVPTVVFSLANAITKLGHKVVILNTNGTTEWFDDCEPLKGLYERRNLIEWADKGYGQLDLLVDVDGFLIPTERRRVAKKVVVFLRKPFVLNEIELSVYPIAQPVRSFECDAVWTWDYVDDGDIRAIELLSQKPVLRIPYTWSPAAVDAHGNTLPLWQETYGSAKDALWELHAMETNMSVCSNMTIPLVIAAHAKDTNAIPFEKVILHNGGQVAENPFFKDNVLNHSKRNGMAVEFVPRVRCTDMRAFPKGVAISHTRFLPIKAILLDYAWNGIPFIHNSPLLKAFGHGFERYSYEDNSITGAAAALRRLNEDYKAGEGLFAPGALEVTRAALSTWLDPLAHRSQWESALGVAVSAIRPVKTEIVVGFSDLWDSANCEYNFWTLLLNEAGRQLNPPVKVRGIGIIAETASTPIDVLIFGPFGDVWSKVPTSVPKFHITGENTPSRDGPGVVSNFGFAADGPKSCRCPLWLQYIDWFGADQDRLRNPKTMPVDKCCKAKSKEELLQKKKFCAFVVSNPTNPVRNSAFQMISQYKKVDSAGRLFNNVGSELFGDIAGGGGGELKKLAFLENYRFCIAYENNRADGYITEKILAAKAAGCVPIYWGAENIGIDFNEAGFLNANALKGGELVAAVQALDTDQEEWLKRTSIPAVDATRARQWLSKIAREILRAVLSGQQLSGFPSLLGGGTTAEAEALGIQRGDLTKGPAIVDSPMSAPALKPLQTSSKYLDRPLKEFKWNGKTLLTTFATQKYVEPLLKWLETTAPRVKVNPSFSVRVYLGEDVNTIQLSLLRSQYPFAELRRLPIELKVATFPDLWEPQHFAWKLWLYQDLVQDETLANTLVWYMDAASVIVRWPSIWLNKASEAGICMLEDGEQYNNQWCHDVFCRRLMVTPEELAAHQVVGGIMAFVAGSKPAWKLFTEAWVLGQQRDLITGPKWGGVRPDGKPFGHRHDQSILSLLRLRHKIPVEPLSSVYCHESLRRTFKSGACLYIHRGAFKNHENFAPRIGEVHIISLPRRRDRIQRFKQNHENWAKQVCLRPAVDGRALSMTPAIAQLFKTNDFFWKKAILGCALSHLSLWAELASEGAVCENYLILEDDVKFQPGWLKVWEEASKHIPADYDVLYLGGVLPPNRPGFNQLVERVNECWGQISLNQAFGQPQPTRYFHFCNYAYILSRKGAQKILQGIQERGGYHTSADHMICNRVNDMKHYVLLPQVAGCYQDDDPKYQSSSFNDFSRIDGFDSDLWNNDERFTPEEIKAAQDLWNKPNVMPISDALQDARHPPPVVVKVEPTQTRFTLLDTDGLVKGSLLEYDWLERVLGYPPCDAAHVPSSHEPLDTSPIFFVMKPHFERYISVFQRYEMAGKDFYVVHISDEHCNDPIDWVSYKHCKGVVRMYPRKELDGNSKVLVIPLGPNKCPEKPYPLFGEKPLLWSFFGTKWHNREAELMPLQTIGPNKSQFFADWMDAKQLDRDEYLKTLCQSLFVPCPRGHNTETFRFWEALECGAIPLYVKSEGEDLVYRYIKEHLPILELTSWEEAKQAIIGLMNQQGKLTEYRKELFGAWEKWKVELRQASGRILDLPLR